MAPQRTTVCFLAESFLFLPFSLQLLPVCRFLPKWVRQQAGKRRDWFGPILQHAFLFSTQTGPIGAGRADCEQKALIRTWEREIILGLKYNPSTCSALAPAFNYVHKNLCSVILTCSNFRNSPVGTLVSNGTAATCTRKMMMSLLCKC